MQAVVLSKKFVIRPVEPAAIQAGAHDGIPIDCVLLPLLLKRATYFNVVTLPSMLFVSILMMPDWRNRDIFRDRARNRPLFTLSCFCTTG